MESIRGFLFVSQMSPGCWFRECSFQKPGFHGSNGKSQSGSKLIIFHGFLLLSPVFLIRNPGSLLISNQGKSHGKKKSIANPIQRVQEEVAQLLRPLRPTSGEKQLQGAYEARAWEKRWGSIHPSVGVVTFSPPPKKKQNGELDILWFEKWPFRNGMEVWYNFPINEVCWFFL